MKIYANLKIGIIAWLMLVAVRALAGDNSKPVLLFNGKDLAGWKAVGGKGPAQWVVGRAAMDPTHPSKLKVVGPGDELINTNDTVNLSSESSYGDCILELEFLVGKSTPDSSVDSNSGIKMMNIYEIQIFDSYEKSNPGKVDCGAIYNETPPLVNACKPAGEWQKLTIHFHAPRFDESGKKTANAKFVTVTLNGRVVQDNVEIAHGTNVSRNAPEHPTGPIFLQGDHGAVAFRNIKVTPLKGAAAD
jgi:3-keto-disaccharide hydrolase